MTLAICIKCGAKKFGAWTECRGCGFLPRSNDDIALSMALTDHHQTSEQLAAIAEQIRQGKRPVLVQDDATEQFMSAMGKAGVNRMLGRDAEGNDLPRKTIPAARPPRSFWRRLFGKQ